MSNYQVNTFAGTTPARKQDPVFLMIKWLLISGLIFTTLILITKPIRKSWSQNYLSTGDEYLAQKKYKSAELEYQKSILLYRGNRLAKDRMKLVDRAAADVLALSDFYKEKNISDQSEEISRLLLIPASETDGVKKAKSLIEQGEYQYAILSAKTAKEMDKGYRDAWLYYGIANLDTAKFVELTVSQQKAYLEEAKKAFAKALQIDSESESSKQFLQETSNLLSRQ